MVICSQDVQVEIVFALASVLQNTFSISHVSLTLSQVSYAQVQTSLGHNNKGHIVPPVASKGDY